MSLWKNKYNDLGEKAFIMFLTECLQSRELYMKNTWSTALLRALINSERILRKYRQLIRDFRPFGEATKKNRTYYMSPFRNKRAFFYIFFYFRGCGFVIF